MSEHSGEIHASKTLRQKQNFFQRANIWSIAANPIIGQLLPRRMHMETAWNFMAGGAALGLIAGLWGHIKDIGWKLASLFVERVEISTEYAHNAVIAYLISHYRHSPVYDRLY